MTKDTDLCAECGEEFANHNYVPNTIDTYKCPHPREEMMYGCFHGGDPRDFHPDYESCTDAEIENHKAACKLWDEADARGETPEPEACPSGWRKAGESVVHVLKAPYGIGTYRTTWETQFTPWETDDEGEL